MQELKSGLSESCDAVLAQWDMFAFEDEPAIACFCGE